MPLVNVTVNDRTYSITCDEGEEEHLRELAVHVDSKVRELIETVGQAGEQRLLLMAALLMTDTQLETGARMEKQARDIVELTEAKEKLARQFAELEERTVVALDSAAKRIGDVAVRVGGA
ncbi:MAG TPA: cell division protein ZapA [Rhizomicrobium sp.]|jgi:cell division protein ZapA|nr:cell division protein ZapA [Rhizomicrobium sp.]